jgi:Flp pilus assembly protein TadG
MKKYAFKNKIRHCDKGQSLVEFAILLPVLVILLCGILDFGWIFGNKLLVTYSCREGARYGAVNASSSSFSSTVTSEVMKCLPSYAQDGVTVNAYLTNGSNPRQGDVVVDVEYKFILLTPLASTILGSQDYTTKASCIMKAE